MEKKTYTLKSAKSEIERLEKSREKKREKIKLLNDEIKEEGARLKELESIYDSLYQESLQKKIADAWFKGNKLSGEQITKFLEFSAKIQDKIDIIDIDKAADAVAAVVADTADIHSEEAENDSNSDNSRETTDFSFQKSYNNDSESNMLSERNFNDENI